MSALDAFAALPLTRVIGWTVVHFLWQGTVVAAGAGTALGVLRGRSAQARYAACCVALALMLAAPLCTLTALLAAGGGHPVLDAAPAFTGLVARSGWQRITPLLPWVTLLWLSGFSLLQARTLVHWTRAQRLKRTRTRPLPAAWRRRVSLLCERVGVRRTVRVVESTLADVPMLIGWLSPVILIPSAALCGLTREQLQAVLAHELAHVRRHDALVNLVQASLEALLFFHPAVWWISDRMRVEREFCCDDVAVRISGDTLCYARALSTLEHLRDVPCPAVASNGGSLMHRISRLVGQRPAGMSGRVPGLAPLLLAASLAVLFGVAGIALAGDPQPAARTERAPESSDAARLRRQIAKREAELERLQVELERQQGSTQAARERRDAERAEIDARRAVIEAERGTADDLRAQERKRQRELVERQAELAEREAKLRSLGGEQRSAIEGEAAALREAQRRLEQAREQGRPSAESEERARDELRRELAALEGEAAMRDAHVDVEREAGARERDAEAARIEARLQEELARERYLREGEDAEREALELRRALEEARERSANGESAAGEAYDRYRVQRELELLERERAGRAGEPSREAGEEPGEPSGPSTKAELRQELAERKAAIAELTRLLELQRGRMEAAMRDLERLEAGEEPENPREEGEPGRVY